jgi:hypothetical protein
MSDHACQELNITIVVLTYVSLPNDGCPRPDNLEVDGVPHLVLERGALLVRLEPAVNDIQSVITRTDSSAAREIYRRHYRLHETEHCLCVCD